MRFYFPITITALTLLTVFSQALLARTTSSYGPEVSAEDFDQHVAVLSSLNTNKKRKIYIEKQLNRLGMSAKQVTCPRPEQGLFAAMDAIAASNKTVQYIAQLDNAYQTAGVLEIAERFKTQMPRPNHNVRFNFMSATSNQMMSCSGFSVVNLSIQPTGLDNLDANSLVNHLNALYVEGK